MKPLINSYYYAPHAHSMRHSQIVEDLEIMKDIGTDIISLCVHDWQMWNWMQPRINRFVQLAHSYGFKVHLVPNRWGGLFAGWIDGFDEFMLANPDVIIQNRDGKPFKSDEGNHCFSGRITAFGCTQNPKLRAYFFERLLPRLCEAMEFDGIVWDEPHSHVCYCPYCRELAPDGEPTREWQFVQTAQFINECSAAIRKNCDRKVTISLFIQPGQTDLLKELVLQPELDYIGSDGFVRSPHRHVQGWEKQDLFTYYDEIDPIIRSAGKKTFYLLEAQNHRDADLEDYLISIERACKLPMDQLMYYFAAHEMSDPENEKRFNQATWDAVRHLSKT